MKIKRLGSRWLADESLYIVLGVSLSSLYFMALNAFSLIFLIGLILTTLITSLVFIRSNVNVLGYASALALAFFLSGTKLICWDTASFELPAFFDWMNGLRGAYWDYSKLPTMFFGLGYTLGRDAYRLVYALQALLLVIGLSRITTERRSLLYFAAITYLLIQVFPQLLDHGKGDILALDFSLIALAFAPISPGEDPKENGAHWSIFLLFGSLAIASKLSAVLAILPLGLLSLFRTRIIEVWRHNPKLMTLTLTLTGANFFVNFYNFARYGSVLDPRNVASGTSLSLINHLPRLVAEVMSYPPNLYAAVILLTTLIALEPIISEWADPGLRIRNCVLLFTLLMTPLVFLFEFRESTNFRLIAFPVLAILAMNSRRIGGNPTS